MDRQTESEARHNFLLTRKFLTKVKVVIDIDGDKDCTYTIDMKDKGFSELVDILDGLIALFGYEKLMEYKPVYDKEIEYILSLINNSKVDKFNRQCDEVIRSTQGVDI